MILITSGFENSICNEIFLKSIFHFSQLELDAFHYFGSFECLEKTASKLKIELSLKQNKIIIHNKQIQFTACSNSSTPLSTSSLLEALKIIDHQNDVLVTLPTTKNQILFQSNICSGYTDFLRKYFNNPNVLMSFLSEKIKVLLLTEHLSLKDVSSAINSELVFSKVQTYLLEISKISTIKNVFIAGLNPHAGENGQFGHEEIEFTNAINILKSTFPSIRFYGPLPADSIMLNKIQKDDVFVFPYHDQGLIPFKMMTGLQGINLSLGLPFFRLSVDHGTASNLPIGQANHLSLTNVLKFAQKLTKK